MTGPSKFQMLDDSAIEKYVTQIQKEREEEQAQKQGAAQSK